MNILGYSIRTKGSKIVIQKAGLPSSTGFQSLTPTYITNATPSWRNFTELIYLLKCYYDNPVVQAVINIKAEAWSNMKFSVKDLKTQEIIPIDEYDKDGGKLKDLLVQPNPLQNGSEWLRQFKVNREVFGNGYSYASVPVGFENTFNYTEINVLNNLPPYCISPVLTGAWLEATTKQEIIKHYILKSFNGRERELATNTVFHTNGVNIKLDQNFTQGVSRLIALQKPITNIDKSFESRNVLIKRRGALGAWTPDKNEDGMGTVNLLDDDIDKAQEAMAKYGLLDHQDTQIISPVALKWQKTAMSVKDLMLFEEVESNAIAVANSFGVPPELVRYYLKKGALGTDNNTDEKRLYDSTIIPESKDFMIALNNFFKTAKLGIELIGSFDHLNVLQANKKEEADTKNLKQKTA